MATNDVSVSFATNETFLSSPEGRNGDRTSPIRTETASTSSPCGFVLLRTAVQLSLLMDTVSAIIFISLYQWWMKEESSDTVIPKSLRLVTSLAFSLLASRALLGGIGLTSNPCQRVALGISYNLCFGMALMEVVLSILCWIKRERIHHILKQKWLLPKFANAIRLFLFKQYKSLWIILLGMAIWECVRWQLFDCYQIMKNRRDGDDNSNSRGRTPQSRSTRGSRPWWWSSTPQNELSEPLLSPGVPRWVSGGRNQSYEEDAGLTTPQRRRWFSLFRSTAQEEVGDDGSVDFASVQEEWASRTEEDPLWWSREEEDANSKIPAPGVKTPLREPDISWAHDIETTL